MSSIITLSCKTHFQLKEKITFESERPSAARTSPWTRPRGETGSWRTCRWPARAPWALGWSWTPHRAPSHCSSSTGRRHWSPPPSYRCLGSLEKQARQECWALEEESFSLLSWAGSLAYCGWTRRSPRVPNIREASHYIYIHFFPVCSWVGWKR